MSVAPSAAAETAGPPLGLLALAAFASMAAMRACDSLLPGLATSFGVSTGMAAQTIAAFAVAYGLLQVVYGPLGDRRGKLRVITLAAVGCALASLGMARSHSLSEALAWRALAGAAGGGIVPLALALIGDTVAYERRQVVLTRLSMATISGAIAGQWLGGVVADAWGWRTVFVGIGALFAVVAAALWRGLRATQAPAPVTQPFAQQVGGVLRAPWARVVLIVVALEGAIGFAAFSFVPAHLHAAFGLSLGQSGAVMALYGVGGLAWALNAKWLIPRLGERGLVLGGGALLCLAMGLLAMADAWIWAAPGCLLGGIGVFMLHSTLQTHATQMAPQSRGTGVSLFALSLFAGQSLGVTLGALAMDLSSPRVVFGAAMVLLPLLALTFGHLLARHHRGH